MQRYVVIVGLLASLSRSVSAQLHPNVSDMPRHELPQATIEALDSWRDQPGQLLPQAGLLVRAELVEVTASARPASYIYATFRIRHVFHGPQLLEGESFAALFRTRAMTGLRGPIGLYPPPKKGDTGLWVLRSRGRVLSPVLSSAYGVVTYDVRLPSYGSNEYHVAMYGIIDPRELTEPFARTVQEVSALDRNDRLARLESLALAETPQVAVWAVHALAQQPAPGAREFLRTLPDDDRLTPRAQAAMDRVLLELDQESWSRSERRLKLLERWVSSQASGSEINVAGHLGRIARERGATDEWQQELLALIRTAVANENLTIRTRAAFVRAASYLGLKGQNRGDDDADAPTFDFLVEVIESAPELELRRAAADNLPRRFSLNVGRRRATVSGLMESAEDERVRRLLREALHPTR